MAGPYRFVCPGCGARLALPRDPAGKRVLCPRCGQKVAAPAGTPAQRPAAPPEPSGKVRCSARPNRPGPRKASSDRWLWVVGSLVLALPAAGLVYLWFRPEPPKVLRAYTTEDLRTMNGRARMDPGYKFLLVTIRYLGRTLYAGGWFRPDDAALLLPDGTAVPGKGSYTGGDLFLGGKATVGKEVAASREPREETVVFIVREEQLRQGPVRLRLRQEPPLDFEVEGVAR